MYRTIILFVCAVVIGISKAGFGGGTGLLIPPLLAMIMPAKDAVGLMLPLLFLTDILCLIWYWKKWDNRNVMAIIPASWLGIFFGTKILAVISDIYLKKIIGLLACVFAALQWFSQQIFKREAHFKTSYWYGAIAGAIIGVISTLAHIGGLITSMYLLPQKLSNERFVGTTTAIYFLLNLAKIYPYYKLGLLNQSILRQDALASPGIIIGTAFGIYLNRRISNRWFSKVVLASVLAMGIKLLI